MSYQVLARKWRPRDFSTLVGQAHVVRALSHALEQQRLHHAWLFTGTRGVGKTTLARILAKCLNCAQGVTAKPCGQCQACVEIDEGRFVDYIELDAASNRRVEEMTQLLEQAVYAPSNARFKVYTIDEVHMLTGHAFNAMLKTLEEPPPHVKFVLATTDPQKIPATVLSRCLQFNLKQIAPPVIAEHLAQVLEQEQIAYESEALLALGQAAAGSMRDALSLTDQAIAYSSNDIRLETIQSMLGTIDTAFLTELMDGLCQQDASGLMQVIERMHQQGVSFTQALADWAELLSQVAIAQQIPGTLGAEHVLAEPIRQWAELLTPDAVQLFYTVAIHSRNELQLAPSEYTGFMMACLRMLSLVPEGAISKKLPTSREPEAPQASRRQTDSDEPVESEPAPVTPSIPAPPEPRPHVEQTVKSEPEPRPEPEPEPESKSEPEFEPAPAPVGESEFVSDLASESSMPMTTGDDRIKLQDMNAGHWVQLSAQLPLTGWAAQLARQSEWVGQTEHEVVLKLELRSVEDMQAKTKLNTVLNEYFGKVLALKIEYGRTGSDTAHAKEQAALKALQEKAEQSVAADPFIKQLQEQFGAQVVKGSIAAHPRSSS